MVNFSHTLTLAKCKTCKRRKKTYSERNFRLDYHLRGEKDWVFDYAKNSSIGSARHKKGCWYWWKLGYDLNLDNFVTQFLGDLNLNLNLCTFLDPLLLRVWLISQLYLSRRHQFESETKRALFVFPVDSGVPEDYQFHKSIKKIVKRPGCLISVILYFWNPKEWQSSQFCEH